VNRILLIVAGAAAVAGGWLFLGYPTTTTILPGTAGNPPVKRVLFVCIHNSNRSQMAEAFARMLGGDRVEAHSAGSAPSGVVNPRAIAAMKELGYDLTTHRSKSIKDVPQGEYDLIATMGCGDACPDFPAKRRVDWTIPDPKDMAPEQFREVRELIRSKVDEALKEIGAV
jgi:arsenate reductase (thioredoxin)